MLPADRILRAATGVGAPMRQDLGYALLALLLLTIALAIVAAVRKQRRSHERLRVNLVRAEDPPEL